MGCDLCHKSETVIEKPITDLVRKLKSVKQERARRGRQWDRATEKHARINEIKAEIERVKNSIESLKDGFRMLTRENMEAKSAKNKLATIEKVDCEKKIHKIEYKTRELVNYWIEILGLSTSEFEIRRVPTPQPNSMMMSMMPSIYFGAAPEPLPEEEPEEFQASIDRHKLRRIIQLSNLISSFAGPYSRPLPISVGPKTSSITLDDEQLGIAVNMNLTVTCTNLPPHLCFLSAELVNSLPQISGNLLEIESEIAEQWEALNITDLPDSFSDMNIQSGYFSSITGFLGAWKI
ncbi:Oidioi.mRNA.OKI2018_I69.PAR.g10535.t1.cds [Oikopleura dioica]|uniref:Oidioi.mRNA.OKI2018_I69.PAR.g10535.t1.cds n=1 Tax=Oikopleura dioica TaxID=34765 RepID=A0ABN7RYP4_OIKDI|nr:Oidioi.mRNA.OKI2018_I69.PAR.g10535.t1.cds [Oikopleura dioica]